MSRIHLIASILLPLMLFLWWVLPSLGWLWLFSGFAMTGYIVYIRQWTLLLFTCLAFSLPLSVELSLANNHKWFFPSEALLAVLAIALVFSMRKERLNTYDLWPLWWLLAFVPAVGFSEYPLMSFKFMIVNAAYVFVFYYGIQFLIRNGKAIKPLFNVYSLALIPVLLWAIWQFVWYELNPVTLPGIFKPFYNDHTIIGAVLALLAGYFLAMGRKGKRYFFLSAFIMLLVVMAGSRAALLSVVIMLMVYVAITYAWVRRLAPFALVLMAFFVHTKRDVVADYMAYNTSGSREDALAERVKSSANVNTDASNIERLNRWSAAWRMFLERPHTGFGPGTYRFTYLPFQDARYENRLTVKNPDHPPQGSGGTAHSEIFLQLSEAGWLPTFIFLLMLGRWVFYGWRSAVNGHLAAKAGLLGLSTYLFHMNVNNFLTTDAFAFLFWGSAATIMASVKQQDNE